MDEIVDILRGMYVPGSRYDLLTRFAGTCALHRIDEGIIISIYRSLQDLDDEDRSLLIANTYERVNSGLGVLALSGSDYDELIPYIKVLPKSFNYSGGIEEIKRLEDLDVKLEAEEEIDLEAISVPINRNITTYSYEYLINRGITNQEILLYNIRAGIGRMDGRVVFPIYSGWKCVAAVGRSIFNSKLRYKTEGKTSRCLWNINEATIGIAAASIGRVIITEGIFSAISAMHYTGIRAVAILGKVIHDRQVMQLWPFSEIYLIREYGVSSSDIMKNIKKLSGGRTIKVIIMNSSKDPNDMGYMEFMECFNRAVAIDSECMDLTSKLKEI